MAVPIIDQLNSLQSLYFDRAKVWTYFTYGLNTLIFGLGIWLSSTETNSAWTPVLVLPLAIGAFLTMRAAGDAREVAESLKRRFEFANGLGLPIDENLINDLKAKVGESKLQRYDLQRNQFTNSSEIGVHQLLKNISESAWWSSDLAKTSARLALTIFVLAMVACFFILYVFIINGVDVAGENPEKNVVRTISTLSTAFVSFAVFLITIGLLGLQKGYNDFSGAAENAFQKCRELLQNDNIPVESAMIIVGEYQLQRAASPLLPGFVYYLFRKSKNRKWDKLKSSF